MRIGVGTGPGLPARTRGRHEAREQKAVSDKGERRKGRGKQQICLRMKSSAAENNLEVGRIRSLSCRIIRATR